MRVLIIGSGAREHALAWTIASGRHTSACFCAPGNPGIGQVATLVPLVPTDVDGLAAFVRRERIDLTIVGPELPLAHGLADRFAAEGQLVVGPTRAAAQLETSKAFAKAFMARHHVPTARFRTCTDPAEARRAVEEFGAPVVVKADGLAAGKGVVVAMDGATALAAVDAAMVAREFGDAGATVIVEEFLRGDEASFFCLCDGTRALPFGTAQDHKRVNDDDQGPNTGGMGAFAPSPLVTAEVRDRVVREIVDPVLAGMREEGMPFRGFLYVGLMLASDGPKVVEFNVRFGDPEAQVVLPLADEDLVPMLADAAAGRLTRRQCRFKPEARVGVVLASGGYPGRFEKGKVIAGLDEAAAMDDVVVFHAGTGTSEGRVVTDGGRVLTVVGAGPDHRTAAARAYEAVGRINFEAMHYRRDIGRKALCLVPGARHGLEPRASSLEP
jgi:phosphoribosylamine--glycine ligase